VSAAETAPLLKPRALRPGDRIALVAPASPFDRAEFDSGVAELRALGFDPVYDERVFARHAGYLAGDAALRAASFLDAWHDDSIAALIAVRGGYGSVHLLPLLQPSTLATHPKLFVGCSDNTSLLTFLTQRCGLVAVHGPMIEGRFARGEQGYDRDSFMACVSRPAPIGALAAGALRTVTAGEHAGVLTGGTLSQIVASLGTPFAFDPPDGCILFMEDVAERPYRIDRMVTQLRLAGILRRAGAVVWGEMARCAEPSGTPTAFDVVTELFRDFSGPVVFGFPSGHTSGPCLTLPLGVRARVLAGERSQVIVEEAAVSA
jgi:muramoyltetrapeptide carboxypeptidase